MNLNCKLSNLIINLGLLCSLKNSGFARSPLPNGFVRISESIPSIRHDIRYFGIHNFIGEKIKGYKAPECILTIQASNALKKVQNDLLKKNYSLKVYDCYRPQQAVNHFVNWAKDLSDTKMKKEFYPLIQKKNLFSDGYIAKRSGHSRGSTIDLTIVKVPTRSQDPFEHGDKLIPCYAPYGKRYQDNTIDMGTGFDCFDIRSHTANQNISAQGKLNRELLKNTMEKYGFKNYRKEWWHYTLRNEPYPKKYFDFIVN